MDVNMSNSLSTVEIIENNVQKNIGDFDVTDTMGSMINNVEFKRGYDDFANQIDSNRGYVWKAI